VAHRLRGALAAATLVAGPAARAQVLDIAPSAPLRRVVSTGTPVLRDGRAVMRMMRIKIAAGRKATIRTQTHRPESRPVLAG